MKKLHPNWTDKQCGNVLYWQNQLKCKIQKHVKKFHCDFILSCGSGFGGPSMEAAGINVIKTVRLKGIPIKRHPDDMVYLVCLIGYSRSILHG